MENENIILQFLKNFRDDMDGKLDTLKTDINDKFKSHSSWIDDTAKENKSTNEKLGKRIGTLEQNNAVYKFQMKIIGTLSSAAFAGAVSFFIFLLTRSR